MENSNQDNGNGMSKNDWQNADSQTNDDSMIMPGTAGNISSPTDQYTGYEFENSDRQDDPGNARENESDDEDTDDEEEEETEIEEDDSLHKSDWGDIDPQHDRSSSNDPSFPGSAI